MAATSMIAVQDHSARLNRAERAIAAAPEVPIGRRDPARRTATCLAPRPAGPAGKRLRVRISIHSAVSRATAMIGKAASMGTQASSSQSIAGNCGSIVSASCMRSLV